MKQPVTLLLLMLAFASVRVCSAQGCSDAGFCTLGSLKHQASDSIRGSKLQLLVPFGIGDEDVRIFTPSIQYDHQFSSRWSVQARISGNYASGNLGAVAGAGDVYAAGIHTVALSTQWSVAGMIAVKIPLDRSDLEKEGRDLPMVYQSSLGTVDAISGVSFIHPRWVLSLGWQQPLSGRTGNGFLWSDWDMPEAFRYPQSNAFKRKGDVLFRITYSSQVSSWLLLQGGVLNIYHLAEDTYINPGVSNNAMEIRGSQGLTLNITASAWMRVAANLKAGLSAGIPLVVRDVRPDGLTRHFVVSPELQWTLR